MLASQIPLLEPRAFRALCVAQPVAGEFKEFAELRKELAPAVSIERGVATITVQGVLAHRPDLFELAFYGMEDTAAVTDTLRATSARDDVDAIVLDFNSPGGFSVGGADLAEAVHRSRVPVVSYAGGLMCSLAYWIGSQASAVVAARGSMLGSIGAYIAVEDVHRLYEEAGVDVRVFKNREGKFKAAGVPGTALTDEQAAHFADQAQALFDTMRADILRRRPGIGAEAMQGQTFDGPQARRLGLADSIGDLGYAQAIARRLSRSPSLSRQG